MKTLSREGIQRMIDGQGASSGGGGGIQSLAGYATQAWTEENYLSKPYFNQLFTVHTQTTTTVVDDQGEPVGDPVISYGTLAPNTLPGTTETTDEETGYVTTVTTVITSIEAKFGFWSQSFISALGQGSGGGGGATALTDLVDVAISSVENGQVLMYDSTLSKWVNGTVQSGGATTLTALTDVAISSVENGQVLMYDSTLSKWVNGSVNATSATKLATARTLWGQSFDGTANVSGDMDGVGYIKANNFIDVTKSTASDCSVSVKNSNGSVSLLTATNRGLYDTTSSNWIAASNGTNSFLMIGNVGIGTTSPAYKLDVNGYAKATRLYLSDTIYLTVENNGVHVVGGGLYADTYVSALGQGSGGGGGATALTDLTDVEFSGTPSNGQVLKYNGTTHKWYNGNDEGLTSLPWSSITGKPTTLSGYGITDAYTKNETDNKFLTIAFFRSLFKAYTSANAEVVPNSGDTTTIASIKAMFGFWTEQYISALGQGSGGGGGGGGGASALTDLTDVEFSGTPSNGQVLKYNGTTHKWYNGTDEGVTSLAWSQITNKPTTLAGYGITDAYTKTEADGLYLKLSGGTMSNTNVVTNMNADLLDGLNGADYLSRHNIDNDYDTTSGQKIITVTNGSTIVSENRYGSLIQWGNSNKTPGTADNNTWYNQLIGMTNDRLYFRTRTNEGDWTTVKKIAFISDFSSWALAATKPSYAFSELTSHPTTLSGYGITDAKIASGVITLGSNSITPLTASDHPSRSYTFTSNTEYAAKWHRLGNYKTAGDASNFAIILYTGSGYNANPSQNSFARIVVKDGWQQTPAATNSVGVTLERFGNFDSSHEIKAVVVATSNTEGALWVYLPWTYTNGNYTISGVYDSWTHNSGYTDDTTTDPTSNQRDTVYFDIVYNKTSLPWSSITGKPTTLGGYGITDAYISSGTIYLGGNSITPLTSFTETDPTVPAWAKASTKPSYSFSELTGTVAFSQLPTMYWADVAVSSSSDNNTSPQFGNLRLRPGSSNYGSYLRFGDGDYAYIAEISNDHLTYRAGSHTFNVSSNEAVQINSSGLRIGGSSGVVLSWDSTNNALKVQKADGTAANLYATGGVSALGMSGGSGGSISNLRVTGTLNIGSSYASLYCSNNNYIHVDATRIYFDSALYMGSNSIRTESGDIYTEEGNIYLGGGRLYLDSSRYIYLDGTTLKFYDGSTAKTIYTY